MNSEREEREEQPLTQHRTRGMTVKRDIGTHVTMVTCLSVFFTSVDKRQGNLCYVLKDVVCPSE